MRLLPRLVGLACVVLSQSDDEGARVAVLVVGQGRTFTSGALAAHLRDYTVESLRLTGARADAFLCTDEPPPAEVLESFAFAERWHVATDAACDKLTCGPQFERRARVLPLRAPPRRAPRRRVRLVRAFTTR